MAKKKTSSNDTKEHIDLELQKLSPQKGDIFVLNINTDDPELLYSEDILDSVESLSDTLEEFTGSKIPILVFGNDLNLELLTKEELDDLIERLEELREIANDNDDDNDNEYDEETEKLTDMFN